MPRFWTLLPLSLLLFWPAGCQKREKKRACAATNEATPPHVVVPKFFTSRTPLELQIRLVRSLKISAYKAMRKWLLGGLIKKECAPKALNFDFDSCIKGMDLHSLQIAAKKWTACPTKGPPPSDFGKHCPVKGYCAAMEITVRDKNGRKKTFIFNKIAKVAKKWWVLGTVSCQNVP